MENGPASQKSRRQIFREGGVVAAGAGALWLTSGVTATASAAPAATPAARDAAAGDEGPLVTVKESTNLCVTASPDGRSLAVDVAGGIWVLPAEGGAARRITPLTHDATRPHWSPAGGRIVFQSFRDGLYQVFSVRPDGSGLKRHTSGASFDLEPRFSPDGKRIAFSSDRGHRSTIWIVDAAGGEPEAVTEADAVHAAPAWSPDGRKLVYVVGGTRIESYDLKSGKREQLLAAPKGASLYSPSFSPDGRQLAYVRASGADCELVAHGEAGEKTLVTGEDLAPLPAAWTSSKSFLYGSGGRLRRGALSGASHDVPFTAVLPVARRDYRREPRDLTSTARRDAKGIADPVLSRDGEQIAFRALNALWVQRIGGRARKVLDDGYFVSDPDFMPDGRSLVYVSDRAGTANLWRLDLESGRSRRLTDLPAGQLTPRVSPDGERIAYQDESGAVWVLDTAAGKAQQVLPALYQPGRPAWSPDGRKLALAALRPYSRRTETGHNQILVLDLDSQKIRYQEIAPDRSLSTRNGDGPLWTQDGKYLIFGAESLAWRAPVDADGTLRGAPERLTSEVTDSLSLGGGRLAYLCNGVLRTVPEGGGEPRTVRTGISYRPARVTERTVVRAGALWDGVSAKLRRNVDVVVRDGLIEDVVEGSRARGANVVDASGLTLMPGLIDTHNHWNMRGKQWGDRQGRLWLSYGVTTSRSPGDPAYQMAENREAMEAGTRVGPRYLGSGEALDGARASYNCMRTTMSPEQLERELDRAAGLDYDLVKSYMRMPVAMEQRIVERAHARGVPVTSHYLYPAAHTGLDGMEHPGGGHRLGYSRTLSFNGYRMSQDAVDLLARSGMWVSTTTIFASELLAEDRSLVEDERTKVLYPDWEYKRLVAKADGAGEPGPGNEFNRRVTKGMVDALLRVHRAGGLVVCGSDSPLDDIGISMQQNLRALVKYGFTPREALTTATGNAARALGYGKLLGTVEKGRIADLVAVEGDPLSDIAAAAAVRTVMVAGRSRSVKEILDPFRPGAFAATKRQDGSPADSVRRAAASAAHDPAHYWHRPEWSVKGCCHE